MRVGSLDELIEMAALCAGLTARPKARGVGVLSPSGSGGGMLVEVYKGAAVRLAPVSEETARAMIGETRAATMLGGWRGRPPGDVGAAARAVARLSEFVADFQGEVREVEINPLAVLERGVCALDCVINPRETSS